MRIETDIILDGFTPCLIEIATGKIVDTAYCKARPEELSHLSKDWQFDWTHVDLGNTDIYKITLMGYSVIQGLVALQIQSRNSAVYIRIAESAPHNLGKNKQYQGVGGHLFAVGARISFDMGFDGFLFLDAKNTDLVEHYAETLGAKLLGRPHPYRMVVDEEAATELLARYTLMKGD